MRLHVKRTILSPDRTLGKLYIDYQNGKGEQYFCDTLEDTVRKDKIFGKTAIPAGQYRCLNTMSARFKAIMPYIQDVNGFIGVRIHAGNSEADTLGCILVGTIAGNRLINSTIAYNKLWAILKLQKNGYDLQITD